MPRDPGGRLQWAFRSRSFQGHSPADPPLPGGEWKPGCWPLNVMGFESSAKGQCGSPVQGAGLLLAWLLFPPGFSCVAALPWALSGVSREHHQEA